MMSYLLNVSKSVTSNVNTKFVPVNVISMIDENVNGKLIVSNTDDAVYVMIVRVKAGSTALYTNRTE